jgi:hypothetical protein
MSYTIQSIKERFSIAAEDVEKYIKTNKIKVDNGGRISEKAYMTLLDLFSSQEKFENGNNNCMSQLQKS